MSLLENPKAQALLADACVTPELVETCQSRLTEFLQRYLPLFYREEQRAHALLVVQGHLSDLERKTTEPIANQAGQHRKPVQNFVGAGAWDDEAVLGELRRHVREELGAADAVLVLDPSSFPKKGPESCGVAGSGADAWAKSTTARWGSFGVTCRPRDKSWRTDGCT
jgi:SRSO17 transposase